jgi:hypothetical protein
MGRTPFLVLAFDLEASAECRVEPNRLARAAKLFEAILASLLDLLVRVAKLESFFEEGCKFCFEAGHGELLF